MEILPEWLNVSRETLERLRRLMALVAKWNPAINLIARSTLDQGWTRHILDSAQVFFLAPKGARHWVDLGSGGGFPGLVVATMAQDSAAELRFTLVESDQRKATFLREAARELELTIKVIAGRSENLPALGADVLSARAFAPLDQLCAHGLRHLAPDGTGLFMKGGNFAAELASARRMWRFDVAAHASKTDPAAFILELKAIAHV